MNRFSKESPSWEQQMMELARQQRFLSTVITTALLVILCLFLLAGSLVIPRLSAFCQRADAAMTQLETLSAQLEQADLPAALENLDTLASASQDGMQQALDAINAIDTDALNDTISDLAEVIAPLSQLFGTGQR